VTYGYSPQAHVHSRTAAFTREGATARVVIGGEEAGELHVPLPGRHALLNALATVAVASELGIGHALTSAAIAAFSGVARRFEKKGERGGVVLVDDYAHHPTEVAATLQAARQVYPEARIVAVFQPHLFTRTQRFAQEFGEALLGADVVLVVPIYPAREQPLPGVTHELVVAAARRLGHRQALVADSFEAALAALAEILRPGDLLLTLGAGNVVHLGERWLQGEAQ